MKNAFFLIFLLFVTSFATSQEGIINGRIDLTRNLADFNPKALQPGPTIYGITGSIGSVKVINETPSTFKAETEFLEALWASEKDLVGFKGILVFQSITYSELVTVSRRNAEPQHIVEHRKLMIFGRLTSYRDKTPVFEVLYHRIFN